MKIKHIKLKKNMKVSELIDEFDSLNVLGAGRLSKARKIVSYMINDEKMAVFLSLGGPLVPGGLRTIIADMIKDKQIDVLITSGANITHDLLESFGGKHYNNLGFDDEKLNSEGIGRIGDIYTKNEDFVTFEERICLIFEDILDKKINTQNQRKTKLENEPNEMTKDEKLVNHVFSIKELLFEIGKRIKDENSILKSAADNNVPIFAPGLTDSMLGLQLWMFSQENRFILDVIEDMNELSDFVFKSEKVGAILLGGGLPKHYTLASNLLKGGLDTAIQITMDRSETGSLSGAPLEEAKSWSKAKCGSNLVTVIGDVTIIFPLLMASLE
ncbi:deoxyhypusine synthase [Methanobrevibacter curvatus]|uniref:Probable deoxyhypusine synthase n=1 Tax=Methanobrevibacter curvatus TaxID=49547 RepID=A0A166CTD7_9EURY|nr:deoxyhypusine synthase [Methanobrevibacter curvatus]KZX14843.1 deoxyhypusine synthase-like protein [Methanobrevibacter curvatus]